MSHLKERAEKNCLNCNAQVHGKYCHLCGQENIEPAETAWHLITHFFQDITHFDGKFFSTMKYLLLKPGFLSMEYKIGRRASYLNPVRLYIFTSAIFFLIFFSLTKVENNVLQRKYYNETLESINSMDSAQFRNFLLESKLDTTLDRNGVIRMADSLDLNAGFHLTGSRYNTRAAYDSVLASGKKKHNWLQRQLIYREIAMNEKYQNDKRKILRAYLDSLIHTFPQMLFVALPIFALLLKLLYIRKKDYHYVNHAIFSIHLYVFVFIMMFAILVFREFKELSDWGIWGYLSGLVFLIILFYEYKAMRNFYQQRRAKTILKFMLLNFLSIFMIAALFIVFMFFSFLKM